MPIASVLPLVYPGAATSALVPAGLAEMITTFHNEEKDFLAMPPVPDLAWADVGTATAQAMGIAKFPKVLPSSLNFEPLKPGGNRTLQTFDAAVQAVSVDGQNLAFGIPMALNSMGNGWQLMSADDKGTLIQFLGIPGMGAYFAYAGKNRKCLRLGSLFYNSCYITSAGLTAPTQFTYAQGLSTGGIALFSDGTGGDGTTGANHYANPRVQTSPRYANVFPAYGAFQTMYGQSLQQMTRVPHPTLANRYSGAKTTDTFIPSYMLDQAWRMQIQSLTLESRAMAGGNVGAATTNPYAEAVARGMTQDNFIGSKFGPRTFWVVSELDTHPYVLSKPGGNATPDFWINVSTGAGRATWGKAAASSSNFLPTFRMYGPGDPRAESEQLMRFEGTLYDGAQPGEPGEIQMFLGV